MLIGSKRPPVTAWTGLLRENGKPEALPSIFNRNVIIPRRFRGRRFLDFGLSIS